MPSTTTSKRLFIFNGGGLAPSLNPTLYGAISEARQRGWQVFGGLFGWASLLRNGRFVQLDGWDIESLKENGGTFLRSSRVNPLAVSDGLAQVTEKLREREIDAVLAIGGDDTLSAARQLAENGLPIVGVPKTIDNDLSGTYFTPGFPSAAHCLASFCEEIKKDAAYALSRIFVVEALGMRAGWLSAAAIYGQADVILPPEWPINFSRAVERIGQCYEENGNYALVAVAQEARFDEPFSALPEKQIGEQYGHRRQSFICLSLRDRLQAELGIETKALYAGNFLETGKPLPVDRDWAIRLGQKAIQLIEEKKFGWMPCLKRRRNAPDLFVDEIALTQVVGPGRYRKLPDDYFDQTNFKPTQKFLDYMEPILGPFREKDDDYLRLIEKIKNKG